MEVHALAKVNLFLQVCGRRPDGFHDVQTLMHSIDLSDRLFFESTESNNVEFEVLNQGAPSFKKNLVGDAWRLTESEFPRKVKPLRVRLEKNIPSGAGLGGGSSDAAATLIALNECFDLDIEPEDMIEGAAMLGSDVPFFLQGGCQLASGRGELLEPLSPLAGIDMVVVKPDFSIATKEAYRGFSGLPLDAKLTNREIAGRISAIRARKWQALRNSFDRALASFKDTEINNAYREICSIRQQLESMGCEITLMCGSGSAVFGITDNRDTAEIIAEKLTGEYPFAAAASTTTSGYKLIRHSKN